MTELLQQSNNFSPRNSVNDPQEGDSRFKNFRTKRLTIGTLTNPDLESEFRNRVYGDPYVRLMINQMRFSTQPQEIELIWLSGRDLGLERNESHKEILKAGKEAGYGAVDPEVGLYLWREDSELALGDRYWIAMEPQYICPPEDFYPQVLRLERDEFGLRLRSFRAQPGTGYIGSIDPPNIDDLSVFRKIVPEDPESLTSDIDNQFRGNRWWNNLYHLLRKVKS